MTIKGHHLRCFICEVAIHIVDIRKHCIPATLGLLLHLPTSSSTSIHLSISLFHSVPLPAPFHLMSHVFHLHTHSTQLLFHLLSWSHIFVVPLPTPAATPVPAPVPAPVPSPLLCLLQCVCVCIKTRTHTRTQQTLTSQQQHSRTV